MRGHSLAGLLAMLLTTTAVACTGAPSSAPGTQPHVARSPAAQPGAQVLGAPGCRPASPVTRWHSFLPQVEGTGHGVTLWGLLMFPHPLPARVGDQEKIVWRMTGMGALKLTAIGPDGGHHRLTWGPDPHQGSDWDKPGGEWGSGYVFTAPGCWDLRATRGHAAADVWIRVAAR